MPDVVTNASLKSPEKLIAAEESFSEGARKVDDTFRKNGEASSGKKRFNQDVAIQLRRKKRLGLMFWTTIAVYAGVALVYINIENIPLLELLRSYWLAVCGICMIIFSVYYYLRAMISMPRSVVKIDFVDVDEKYTNEKTKVMSGHITAEKVKGYAETLKRLSESEIQIQEKTDPVISCLKQAISILEKKASASDEKASILLQKGISYTKFGIGYYLFSILVWQVLFWLFGFKKEHLYGIISCSFLFLFVEFLSAWFLKQYKNFTDNSVYLLKIKSIFDRFLIVYTIEMKENDNVLNENNNYSKTIELISRELIWPDVAVIESKESGFSKETMSSLSDLVNALKKKELVAK